MTDRIIGSEHNHDLNLGGGVEDKGDDTFDFDSRLPYQKILARSCKDFCKIFSRILDDSTEESCKMSQEIEIIFF